MTVIPNKFPLNVYDELLFHLDKSDSPLNLHMEVCVQPRIDEEKLRHAIAQAALIHPMAQVSLAPYNDNDNQFFWQYHPQLSAMPLEVKECQDSDELSLLRNTFYSAAIPLLEAPAFRSLLVHLGEESHLMLKFSNVLSDSHGVQHFMHSVLRAYAGEQEHYDHQLFLAARDLSHAAETERSSERLKAIGTLLEALDTALKPPAKIATTGSEQATGVGLMPIAFSREQTQGLSKSSADGIQMPHRIIAALNLAVESWNTAHNQSTGRISLMRTFNTREEAWQENIASNLSLWVNINSQVKDRQNPHELLHVVQQQVDGFRDTGVINLLVEIAQEVRALPAWLRQIIPGLLPITGNRLLSTAVTGALNPIAAPQLEGIKITQWWFSPPCRFPTGLSSGSVSYDDRLYLCLRYHKQQFCDGDAWGFTEMFLDHLNAYSLAK